MLFSRWKFVVFAVIAALVACYPRVSAQVHGQALTGDCEIGDAEAYLDVGNVRAKVLNSGALFHGGGGDIYEVPAGIGLVGLYSANLMIGGRLGGDVRVSATNYGPFEMWPGPLPEDGTAPDDCTRFNRIYSVRYDGQWAIDAVEDIGGDVEEWPVDLGAPFVNRGGTSSGYNPAAGDRPEMLGDQMLWWLMNDRGNEHAQTGSAPLGVEVRVSAFAFRDAGTVGEHTFYRYRIRNRNDAPIRATYVGLHTDWGPGAAFDTYVGSDSASGLAYAYNSDNFDNRGYGEAPPAVGLTVLKRPESTIDVESPECRYDDGKAQGLTSHIHWHGGHGLWGDARTGDEFYAYMQSRLVNGAGLRIGGVGGVIEYGPLGERTNFVYPGDPVGGEYWSETNVDGEGNANSPAGRKSYSAVGPFCLGPGDETEVVFAYLWARGSSNLDSVTRLRTEARSVQQSADDLLRPRRIGLDPYEPSATAPSDFGAAIYPNPATDAATLRLGLPQSMDVRIEVFDALGRRVPGVANDRLAAGDHRFTLPTADWPSGIYLVRMQLDHFTETRRLVVVK